MSCRMVLSATRDLGCFAVGPRDAAVTHPPSSASRALRRPQESREKERGGGSASPRRLPPLKPPPPTLPPPPPPNRIQRGLFAFGAADSLGCFQFSFGSRFVSYINTHTHKLKPTRPAAVNTFEVKKNRQKKKKKEKKKRKIMRKKAKKFNTPPPIKIKVWGMGGG